MKKMRSILLVTLLITISVVVILRIDPKRYKSDRYTVTEEIIIEDYWKDNTLKITRVTESSEEGTAVRIPTDIMMKDDRLLIFNSKGNNIIEINMAGEMQNIYPTIPNSINSGLGVKDGYLYYKTPWEVYGLDLSSKESRKVFTGSIGLASFDKSSNTFYIIDSLFENVTIIKRDKVSKALNMNDVFANNGLPRPRGHRRLFKGHYIYSPTEFKYITSEEAYFESESYTKDLLVINIATQKIESINSKGEEFGYYILGIDNERRIYTATSLNVDRILIHDKHGNFLLEIKPECAQYGKPVSSIYDELLVHPVYITEDGHIFIMIQSEEGTFIVRYTHSA